MEDKTIAPEGGVASTPAPVVIPTTPVVDQKLPENVSDRTAEQFEKLKDSNKRLYEANQLLQQEVDRKKLLERQFSPIQNTVPQDQPTKVDQFIEVDPVTGEQFVNEDRLKRAIGEAQERATRAEQSVQNYIKDQQKQEEQRQTEEAYNAYPELNPKDSTKFDPELTRRTRAFLLDSMVNPSDYKGRALTFREAADLAKKEMGGKTPAPEAPKTEKEESKNDKQQVSQEAQGVSSSFQQTNYSPDEELTSLRMKSRMGDMSAIAKRLTQVDHTFSDSSKDQS